ncbi:MAG: hypothetical protein KKF89_05170 [Nanoarchaeota archaeon]|nr:hypothetical protein [Nanoarchaeota archaeon]MBU1855085.1 hypothetical protein [Nanoarchaeota archaeon]
MTLDQEIKNIEREFDELENVVIKIIDSEIRVVDKRDKPFKSKELEELENSVIKVINNKFEVVDRFGKPIDNISKYFKLARGIDQYILLKKGKYEIDFPLIINSGGTLEIEPGTELDLNPLFAHSTGGIICYGTLKAIGTEKEKIIFTSHSSPWRNITVAGENSNDSILKNCIIEKGLGQYHLYSLLKKEYLYTDTMMFWDFPTFSGINTYGGGIFITKSNCTIQECLIQNNIAGSGGGILLFNSDALIKENIIVNNKAYGYGGGICAYKSSNNFRLNKITNNHADIRGGGLYSKAQTNELEFMNEIKKNTHGTESDTIIKSFIHNNIYRTK